MDIGKWTRISKIRIELEATNIEDKKLGEQEKLDIIEREYNIPINNEFREDESVRTHVIKKSWLWNRGMEKLNSDLCFCLSRNKKVYKLAVNWRQLVLFRWVRQDAYGISLYLCGWLFGEKNILDKRQFVVKVHEEYWNNSGCGCSLRRIAAACSFL